MSIGRAYWLLCDHEGCEATFEGSSPFLDNVRQQARREDWITGPTGDYCPNHREDICKGHD